MKIRWRLRMAAAQREIWTGAQLRRLLAERAGLQLSSASVSVSVLFSKEPAQVKLSTLAALCTASDCTPNDLFDVDATPVEQPPTPGRATTPGHGRIGPRPVDAAGAAEGAVEMGTTTRLRRLRCSGWVSRSPTLLPMCAKTPRTGR